MQSQHKPEAMSAAVNRSPKASATNRLVLNATEVEALAAAYQLLTRIHRRHQVKLDHSLEEASEGEGENG